MKISKTVNGKVTLRGPVDSESEKSGAVALARNIAGDGNVDDQLEVNRSIKQHKQETQETSKLLCLNHLLSV
jgi:osmotically-inducible protein OsmY